MNKFVFYFLPFLRWVVITIALVVFPVSAQAPLDIRIALVIGNAAYAGDGALVNPVNDAKAMSEALRGLGFTVVEIRDGTKIQIADAIVKIRESLKGKQAIGMLYYAGHGLQLDWRNYMVPVDAKLSKASDVTEQTVDINSVIEAFKGAGNRMNILILDACRNNPFASTSSGKGLAQLDAPQGTFLAYATAPGNVAEDGDAKSTNGLYTQFLLQELKKPTAKIEDVFKRVRLNVRQQSQGRQIPWESTSLEEDFYFNTGVKVAKPDEKALETANKLQNEEWKKINTSVNPDDYFAFLQKYPLGSLTEEAQFKLDKLAKPKVVATLGKDQNSNLAYTGDRFLVGDEYEFQFKDALSGAIQRTKLQQVTGIKGTTVEINSGQQLLTMLGGIIKNESGQFDPPYAPGVVEYQVGKVWETRSTLKTNDGFTISLQGTAKIIGRETITLPAGTFPTYVVEFKAYSSSGWNYKIKSWVDPRYGYSLKRENISRDGKGKIVISELRELIRLKADRS
jgi:hypothetical protein